MKNVLILGSGGENKYGYLEWLVKLGANVVLLDPDSDSKERAGNGWETFYADFNNIDSLIKKVLELNSKYSFSAADTIFELTMEHAAAARKALGLKGLTPELVNVGRDKTVMAGFMRQNGVRTPPYIVFNKDDDLKEIQNQIGVYKDAKWILKPDIFAGGIGIKKINDPSKLFEAFESAKTDISISHYRHNLIREPGAKWILSRYIDGFETEADICVHKGEVIFFASFLKTINLEREWGIEENRCVTPIPWLKKESIKDMEDQIQKVAKAVYEKVMKPCGKETLIVYPEFRIDKNNKAYIIEFAFRNGGYLNPFRIEESRGISPLYFSAAATLGLEPKVNETKTKCASGYQLLFSDRKGRFDGIKGINMIPGISIKQEARVGDKINVPQSEVLCSVIGTSEKPEDVEKILNIALKDAKVIVDGNEIEIPLSSFVV